MINTAPLGSLTTFGDYGRFLSQRYIIPHFTRGITEVHLIFDKPKATPKYFEQKKRDEASPIAPEQTHNFHVVSGEEMYCTAVNAKDI